MIKLYLPGADVPEWLEKQKPQEGYEKDFEKCSLKFKSVVVVCNCRGKFRVINLLPTEGHMSTGGGRNVCITGQSPHGFDGKVVHYGSLFTALEHLISSIKGN